MTVGVFWKSFINHLNYLVTFSFGLCVKKDLNIVIKFAVYVKGFVDKDRGATYHCSFSLCLYETCRVEARPISNLNAQEI